MVTHGSATMRAETPHEIETTEIGISDAVRRRAQSLVNDRSIDPRWRAIIRYGLETNDPWLRDLVRRADAHETIVHTTDFSQISEVNEADRNEEKIEALAGIICRSGDESAAALLVLMAALENSTQPKVLANTAKHYAFSYCGELNLYGMVDAQVAVLEYELLASEIPT